VKARTFDFVVVGGGLVGAAIAYGLAERSRRVAMLDEGDRALRAARGNFGLIWVQGKGIDFPAYAAWTRTSAQRWSELATRLREETGIDVALEQRGGVHLCLSERELVKRTALAAGVRGDLTEGERARRFAGHSLRAGLASSAEVDERYIVEVGVLGDIAVSLRAIALHATPQRATPRMPLR